MSLLDQSSGTGGGRDPYNALFVNMDNMWTERFGNYDCLVYVSKSFEVLFQMSRAPIQCPVPTVNRGRTASTFYKRIIQSGFSLFSHHCPRPRMLPH